ncbi:uncharacterized protein LOC126595725 [Malus sylvestris]|uniref:uncharacterized protein LOC126595725 n=1 Tax=Malus sylvestris TaxID=3752 RepID=UPI0021ABB31E|nr:uncharacterized protein LOC126595725 [Malus sylvestris]
MKISFHSLSFFSIRKDSRNSSQFQKSAAQPHTRAGPSLTQQHHHTHSPLQEPQKQRLCHLQNTEIRDRSERKKSQLKIHWTESMAHLESLDLSILKDNNLVSEQRKKTGHLKHHRSASHTKGCGSMIKPRKQK